MKFGENWSGSFRGDLFKGVDLCITVIAIVHPEPLAQVSYKYQHFWAEKRLFRHIITWQTVNCEAVPDNLMSSLFIYV